MSEKYARSNPQEKIIKLLDDYYGGSRGEDIKEATANFVVNYYDDIKEVMENHETS